MSQSRARLLAEEQPLAYKNVDDAVDVVHQADCRIRWGADAAD